MFKIKTLVIALGLSVPLVAGAQSSTADVLKELQALKARVEQLEAQLKAAQQQQQTQQAKPQQGTVDPSEFNRIAVKTESLEDNFEAQGYKGLKINGYADPTFIINQRQDTAGFQFLNNVASDGYNYDNSYMGAVSLDLQKEMEGGTKWRLTLVPNRGTDSVIGNGGIVHEASVSVPLTNLQTRMIAGHIPDWSGYEFLQPTLNKLITHNLLFDFTLPTAYTGAGMEITRGKWVTKTMLANVNTTKKSSGNKTPSLAYRVDYARGEFQGFGFAGAHGKVANFRADDGVGNPITGEAYDLKDSRADLFEFDAYFIRGDVTVQGQLSVGRQKSAGITADPVTGALRDAQWWGASVLSAYKFTPRFEGIARFDFVNNKKNGGGLFGYNFSDDRNGIGPGYSFDDTTGEWVQLGPETGVNRSALSFGLSYLYSPNVTLKGELRLDRANQAVFLNAKDGSYNKGNTLFGLSTVVSW
jgi:hypothetical protein